MTSSSRKLAAIVFADLKGYTALMQRDESLALAKLQVFEQTMHSLSEAHQGKVVNFYGDGCLLVYENVNAAVASALEMQRHFTAPSVDVPVRIGVHAGEVVYRDGNVFSDSVNLASRIESMGVPGSVLLSKAAQQQIRNNPEYQLKSLGRFDFKNVEEPMEVFALTNEGLAVPRKNEVKGKFKSQTETASGRRRILSYVIIVILAIIAVVWSIGFNNNPAGTKGNTQYSSLAIFPFENRSGNADLDYLGDGVAENLINTISKQSEVHVLSRYSTFGLKDSLHNLSFIQKLLNTDAVLMGSIDQNGDDLIFNTELINVKNKEQIWGDKLHGSESDIPGLENTLTQSILSHLDAGNDVSKNGTKDVDPRAYQEYMQGRYLSYGYTPEEIEKSVEHFHKAIEIDPNFAAAYAALANQKFEQARVSNTSRQELFREAKLALATALQLDPNLPEALLAEANTHFYYDFDWPEALQSFQKALAADPDDPVINADFAFFQCAMNNYDEAVALAEKAIRSDPVSISSMHAIAWAHLYKSPEKSVNEFNEIIELHPQWVWGYLKKGIADVLVGDCDDAKKVLSETESKIGDWGGELMECYLSLLYRKCGEDKRAEDKMQLVLQHIGTYGVGDPMDIALLYAAIGDTSTMIEYAKQSIERKSVNVALMQLAKDLDLFNTDPFHAPEYVKLLRELQFPNN